MRLPFTLSELFVIRSAGRIFVPLVGVGVLLLGLWGATVILDRALESAGEDELVENEIPSLTFPHEAKLIHGDGRVMNATLISRPSTNTVTIQRESDGRTFTLDLGSLAPESIFLVNRTAPSGTDRSFKFPHHCTLVNREGIMLPVVLVGRETEDTIKFARRSDGLLFTISLSRLVDSDQELIRQFPRTSEEESLP